MCKHFSLLFAVALLTSFSAFAQEPYKQKLDLRLQDFLNEEHTEGEEMNLFIHGDADAVGAAVRAHGGRVKMALPKLVNVRVPISEVIALANDPAVHHFEFNAAEGMLMNDSMRVKNRTNWVQAGHAPLPQEYDGTGVVIGIIDTGLDMAHPDFRDENDVTRVYRYWDQVPSQNPGSPAPYGYGTEWTREELEAGGVNIPQDTLQGHGTPVSGSAVGNGLANGRHKGVAPKAEIIFVASDLGSANWASSVADGVQYILEQADALGMPAVINISMGSYLGSHDGKDAAALFIDDLLHQRPGRAMAVSAGNSHGTFPYHVRTNVDQDTSFTWYTTNQNGPQYNVFNYPNVYFEIWADAVDFENVEFAIGADRPVPSLNYRGRTPFRSVSDVIGQVVVDPLVSTSGNTLGTVQYYAQERGEQIFMQVLIASPDTLDCLWRFMSTGSGAFDVWTLTTYTRTSNVIGPVLAAPLNLPFPTASEYPAMANYVEPDFLEHIVDSWACIPDVLTVANYCNEVSYLDYNGVLRTVPGVEEDLSGSSSSGPTRDGRMKPDLAATGDVTFSAGVLLLIQRVIEFQVGFKIDPGGMHVRDGGTSQAAPVVAGAAALFLQKCPDATISEVAAAIRASARSDAFTGSTPSNRWGMGKLDVFGMMLNETALVTTGSSFCEGEGVEVTVPGEFASVEWSTGDTGSPYTMQQGGSLSAILQSPTGCRSYSDTLQFTLLPLPAEPVISVEGSTLTSSPADGYQWYLGGEPIDGATDQVWVAEQVGSYTVEAIGANGCSVLSNPEMILTVGISANGSNAFELYPSPVRDELFVQMSTSMTGPVQITVVSAEGRVVRRKKVTASSGPFVIGMHGLAAGSYTVQAETDGQRWSKRFVKIP